MITEVWEYTCICGEQYRITLAGCTTSRTTKGAGNAQQLIGAGYWIDHHFEQCGKLPHSERIARYEQG